MPWAGSSNFLVAPNLIWIRGSGKVCDVWVATVCQNVEKPHQYILGTMACNALPHYWYARDAFFWLLQALTYQF